MLRQDQASDLLQASGSGAAEQDAVALRDHALLELLYATGVRVSELCGLDVADVDFARRVVVVLGKGGKERTVPFGEPAERAVREWLTRGDPRWHGRRRHLRSCWAPVVAGSNLQAFDVSCTKRWVRFRVLPSWVHTACVTPLRRICSKVVRIFGASRSFLVTLRSPPPSYTHT